MATRLKTPQRTLRRAVDLRDMRVISSDDLLALDADGYQAIRRTATLARHDERVVFACERCGYAVYAPREPKTRQAFWRHHKGAPRDCPWWTGEPGSIDGVSGSQFKGAVESPLHLRLKNLVAELLTADPLTEAGSVVVDEYLITESGRRRPDVRAVYDGKLIAVEIQLSTTQIPIIVAREQFYEQEGRHLLWLTWSFEPVERERMLTAFEDIFYSHNKNLFSLDDAVVAASRERGSFFLRAYWMEGDAWHSKVHALTELTWPVSGLPFAVAPPLPWQVDFRNRWLAATTVHGTQWPERRQLLDELAEKIGGDLSGNDLEGEGFEALLNAILSFSTGHPVGSRQSNLIEVINTFLAPKPRHRFARLMRKVITVSIGEELLDKATVRQKFATANQTVQDGPETITGKAALLLFPELFQKRAAP